MPTLTTILHVKLKLFFSHLSIPLDQQKKILNLPISAQFNLIISFIDDKTKTLLFIEIFSLLLIINDDCHPKSTKNRNQYTTEQKNSSKNNQEYQPKSTIYPNGHPSNGKKVTANHIYYDNNEKATSHNSYKENKNEILRSLPFIFSFLTHLLKYSKDHLKNLNVLTILYKTVIRYQYLDGLSLIIMVHRILRCSRIDSDIKLFIKDQIRQFCVICSFIPQNKNVKMTADTYSNKNQNILKNESINEPETFHKIDRNGFKTMIDGKQTEKMKKINRNILSWLKTVISSNESLDEVTCCKEMELQLNEQIGRKQPIQNAQNETVQNAQNETVQNAQNETVQTAQNETVQTAQSTQDEKKNNFSKEKTLNVPITVKKVMVSGSKRLNEKFEQSQEQQAMLEKLNCEYSKLLEAKKILNDERERFLNEKRKYEWDKIRQEEEKEKNNNLVCKKCNSLVNQGNLSENFIKNISDQKNHEKLKNIPETLIKQKNKNKEETDTIQKQSKEELRDKYIDKKLGDKMNIKTGEWMCYPKDGSLYINQGNNFPINENFSDISESNVKSGDLESENVEEISEKSHGKQENIREKNDEIIKKKEGIRKEKEDLSEEENVILNNSSFSSESKKSTNCDLNDKISQLSVKNTGKENDDTVAVNHENVSGTAELPQMSQKLRNTDQMNTEQISTYQINTDQMNAEQINTEQISTYQINTDQMNADQINTENMIQETSAAKPKKMAMRKAPAKKKLDPFIQKLNNLKFKPLLHLKQIKNTIAYEEISKMFTEQDFQVFLRDETSDSMVKPTEKQNIKANISILDIKKSNAIAIALHTQKRAILNTIDLIFNLELMDENFLNVLLRYWPDKNEIYHLNNLIQEEKEPFGESEQLFVIILRKNCLDAFHDAIVRSLLRLKLYDHSDIKNGTKISKKLNDFRTNITSDMKSISEDIKSGQSSKILRPTDMKLRSKFEQSLMDYVFLYDFLCQDKMLLYTLKCIKFITNVLTRQSCSINTLQDPEIRQLVIQKVLNLSENSLEKLEINEKVLNIKLKNYEMLQSELQEIFSLEQLIIKNENDPIFDTLNLLKTLQKEIADLNKKLDTLFGENITEIEIKIILDYYKEVHNHLHLEKDSKNFTFKKIQSKMK